MRIVVNAGHDGQTADVSQEEFDTSIKAAVAEVLSQDDEDMEVEVSTYIERYNYSDNLEDLRQRVVSLLDILDAETLLDLEQKLKEEG